MNCPIEIPDQVRDCNACPYSKEGLCDYPFYRKVDLAFGDNCRCYIETAEKKVEQIRS